MSRAKYLIEFIMGLVLTIPLLEESIRIVLGYNSSLFIYKIFFLLLFWTIEIVGYLLIFDGILGFFFDKGFIESIRY